MPLAPEQNKSNGGWQVADVRRSFPLLPQIARRSLLTHSLTSIIYANRHFIYFYLDTTAAPLLLRSIRGIFMFFTGWVFVFLCK